MEEVNQKNTLVKIVGIIALGIVFLLAVFQKNFLPAEDTIYVSGRGRAPVKLDSASLSLGVATIKAATAEDALRQTSAKIERIKSVFAEMKISENDWQITAYAFDPQYENESSSEAESQVLKTKGYNGFQRITIKLSGVDKDPKMVDNFIERMVKEGVNKIGKVTFTASDIETAKQEAREKALQAAREKAKSIQKTLGVSLGKISSLDESEIYIPGETYSYYDNDTITFSGAIDQVTTNPSIYNQAEVIIDTTLYYYIK
jgi:uncharacterized protein YggE